MSKVTYYICDRCGKAVYYEPADVAYTSYFKGTFDIGYHKSGDYTMDLCHTCNIELLEFLGKDVSEFKDDVLKNLDGEESQRNWC